MVKIKDISERLLKDPKEYLEIKLIVAKRTLALFFMLYYVSFLFTVWGFTFAFIDIDILSAVTFHLYSILVIVMAWFLFSLIEYTQNIYFPEKPWIKIVGIVISGIFGLFGLVAHLSSHL